MASNRIVSIILRGDVAGLRASMTAASASVRDVAGRMTAATAEGERFRRGMTAAGDAAGKFGLVAAAGVAFAVKKYADFDKAMSAVQAATHESEAAMESLREAALDAGAQTAFSATEAAAGVEELAKAGVATKDILDGGLTGALDLAAAGALGVGDAAEIAASAMTQFGLTGDQVPHVADLLAAAAGKAQGSVQDMGAALGQAGLVANQTGLTIEETTGTLAAFAAAGLTGSDSGTSFKTMLQALTPSSKQARLEMERLGISAYDAEGNFVGMTDFADSLKNGLKDLSVEQQNAAMKTIFGADAVRAASVVFEQGGSGIQSWIDKVDDSGFAAETAATRLDNMAGDLEALGGALETALIGTGEGADGPLRDVIQTLTSVVNLYNKLPGPVKAAGLAITGFTAVVGLSAFAATRAIGAYSSASAALTNMGVSAVSARMKMAALRTGAMGLGVGLSAAAAGIDDGNKVLNGLTNAAAGAAIGFSVAGPFGAAIGGAIGLFRGLSGESDKVAISLSGVTETLDEQTGAITENTSQWAVKQLQDSGTADTLAEMGISLETATKAVLGNSDAMKEVSKASKGASFEQFKAIASVVGLKDGLVESSAELLENKAASDAAAEGSSAFGDSATQTAEQFSEAAETMAKMKEATVESAAGFLDLSAGLDDAKLSLQEWLDQLREMEEAQSAWADNVIVAMARGVDDGVIAKFQEMGPAGAKMLDELVNGSQKQIDRLNDIYSDVGETAAKLSAVKDELGGEVVTSFVVEGENVSIKKIEKIQEKYNLTPDQVETIMRALDYTEKDIKTVRRRLAELEAVKTNPSIGVDIDGAVRKISELQRTIDGMNGKTIRIAVKGGTGGGITTDADGSIHTPHGRITRFADGGNVEKHVAQIAPAGAMRVWAEPETGGEAYIPLADSKRVRSRHIAERTIGILGGSVQWFADGGITKSAKLEIKEAQARVRDIEHDLGETETVKKNGKKVKRKVLRGLDEEIARLQLAEAKRALADLKAGRTGVRADAREKAQDKIDEDNKKAKDKIDEDNEAAQKILDDAADLRLSAKTSAVGTFGIGASTSAAAIDRRLRKLLVDSQTFLGLLGDLKSKGASPWLLAQLVEAGPTPGAIRLAREYNANQSALDNVNGLAGQIDSYGNQYASLVGNAAFMAPGAWNSGVSSASTYNINAYAPAEVAAEFVRLIRFNEQSTAAGAGL